MTECIYFTTRSARLGKACHVPAQRCRGHPHLMYLRPRVVDPLFRRLELFGQRQDVLV